MGFWSQLVDGDHGWNMLNLDPEDARSVRIQPIEADRIGNVLNPAETTDKNKIGGITIDDNGAPTAYSIYNRNRLTSQYTFDRDVPSSQFLHLIDPQRVDQYRGVTALATAIAPARDLYEIYEAEKQAAKWQVGHAGFVRQADPYNMSDPNAWNGVTGGAAPNSPGSTPNAGPGTINMQIAKVLRLNQGDEVQFAPGTNRPNGAFLSLVQTMIREICAGTQNGYPYGFLHDISELGGHGSRIEVAQAMRGIARNQNLLSRVWLNPVRNTVLGSAIAAGILPSHPLWKKGRWAFGATLTGDYGNDMAAKMQELSAGLINASDVIAEKGSTFEKVVRKSASEITYMQKVASETGVPIELLTNRLNNPSQLLAAMNEPPPAPPAGLVEAQVDAKPLLEILKQVGEGKMDRASAVTSIIQLYGLKKSEVEKMVPDEPTPQPVAPAPTMPSRAPKAK